MPYSLSDSSTETISVVVVDASQGPPSPDFEGGPFSSQSDETSISTTASSTTPTMELCEVLPASASHCLEPEPGACRSASIDSAYGTLSPTSLQEFAERQRQQQEAAAAEEEEAEEGCSAVLSQRASSPKLRRQTPVQLLPAKAKVLKSKSEANLLQLVPASLHLTQSRSLSELCPGMFLWGPPRTRDSRAQRAARVGGAGGCSSSSSSSSNSSSSELSEAEELPSRVVHVSPALDVASEGPQPLCPPGEGLPAAHRTLSDPQAIQHRKLTLAQLYRIRTTLLLNSTLTAS